MKPKKTMKENFFKKLPQSSSPFEQQFLQVYVPFPETVFQENFQSDAHSQNTTPTFQIVHEKRNTASMV